MKKRGPQLQINDYQKFTLSTAIYPDAGTGGAGELTYLALGLNGEAGEVAEHIKKYLRDNKINLDEIAYELSDCVWYIARLADAIGYTLESILEINQSKLTKRQKENKLSGWGSNR